MHSNEDAWRLLTSIPTREGPSGSHDHLGRSNPNTRLRFTSVTATSLRPQIVQVMAARRERSLTTEEICDYVVAPAYGISIRRRSGTATWST